jgi:hypothetical protein
LKALAALRLDWIGLARMLRMYVAQQCFGLSDEGIEECYDRTEKRILKAQRDSDHSYEKEKK